MSNISKCTTATATATKIQIEQNVPSGSIRKGPYAIERSVDPNNVIIKRRFGEGSKPLFQREDIAVNCEFVNVSDNAKSEVSNSLKAHSPSTYQWHNNTRRSSSTISSSPERYRKHNNVRFPPENDNKQLNTKERNVTITSRQRQKPVEKMPYFVDEVRERDRLRRIYGSNSDKPTSSQRHRNYSKSRSRSLSPLPTKCQLRPQYHKLSGSYRIRSNSRGGLEKDVKKPIMYHASHEIERRRAHSRTPERRRSRSLEHHRSNRELSHHSNSRRRRISRSHSRSRSRERGRTRSYNADRRDEYVNTQEQAAQTTPQIITIPVPIPTDYTYGYPAWPAPPPGQWSVGGLPPPRFATYPMPAMLPTAVMPTLRPPPSYGMAPPYYGGRMFRPQQSRYGSTRPPRANYRPRNY